MHLHHRIQKNIRIRECIRCNHHWGHQTQTTTLCSRSNPHQRRGTFAKSSRNKLIREKPCFCPSFRMCRKGGVPKARILKRRPKLMLEVRWFFRVQILCHSDYWRVVPSPISLEYGEKVFQVFPPYVGSHLPPPIMPLFHPRSLKIPQFPHVRKKMSSQTSAGQSRNAFPAQSRGSKYLIATQKSKKLTCCLMTQRHSNDTAAL